MVFVPVALPPAVERPAFTERLKYDHLILPALIPGLPVAVGGQQQYRIPRSLRFNAADATRLARTPGSSTNQTTWTVSFWMKIADDGSDRFLFGAAQDANNRTAFVWSAGQLQVFTITGGSVKMNKITSRVFRDYSAWQHVVFAYDSANGTAADRNRLYVNGSRVTSFGTDANALSSEASWINANVAHIIGRRPETTTGYWNGLLAEFNFVDGLALDPSYFGKTDAATGVWVPKKYTGAYGTNGYYLDFSDNSNTTSSTLGADRSGNSNDWTPNNFSVSAGVGNDSLVDTPTNYGTDTGAGGEVRGNYWTLSPLSSDPNANLVLSNGNLDARYTFSSVNFRYFRSTSRVRGGKWYAEVTVINTAGVGNNRDALFSTSTQALTGNDTITNRVGLAFGTTSFSPTFSTANVSASLASGTTLFSPAANGDVFNFAVDFDAGKIWIGKNGTWYNSGDPAAGTNPTSTFTSAATDEWAYVGSCGSSSDNTNRGDQTLNFGQRPWNNAAPAGFKALCTQNLPDPAYKKPRDHFDIVLDTGANIKASAEAVFSGSDFMEWIKDRANSNNHQLIDTVRSTSAVLQSNSTGAETTYSAPSGNSVGWAWKKGALLDIVAYIGNGSNRTINHALGVAPKLLIFKNRTSTTHWPVYHGDAGWTATDYLYLSSTGAKNVGGSNAVLNGAPDSSVINVGTSVNSNENGSNIVCFAFAEIAGLSKFGSYTGNGSAAGTLVHCGFKPRFLMVKRTDSTSDWEIVDTARATYNPRQNGIYSNLTNAENTSTAGLYDFLSNGFKLRGTTYNASGATYIFAAFADVPAKYARAA